LSFAPGFNTHTTESQKMDKNRKKRKKKTTHTHKKKTKQTNKHTTYIAMSILTERKTKNVYITIRKNVSL
jgi:hypothetical protein